MPDALPDVPTTFEPFEAPGVTPLPGPLTRVEMMAAMRSNVLRMYGPDAFRFLSFSAPFFGQRSVFTSDPEGIRRFLVDNAQAYTRTSPTFRILRPVLGNGLFLSEGDDWKFQRRTLAPAFTPRAMAIVARVTAEVLDAEVKRLCAEAIGPHDLMPMIQRIALEVAGRAMFSTVMERRGPQLRRLFEGYGRDLGMPFPSDLLLPAGIPGPADLMRRGRGRRWLDFVKAMVEQRKRLPRAAGEARDLFDLMAEAKDPETGRSFGADELRDQFATFIIAGHETTALTLLWAFIMLAESPALQDDLAREAQAVDLAPAAAATATDRLPLAKAVVQETLRLFPPAFLIVRQAKEADQVGDQAVAPGDLVSTAPYVLHRHEAHWDRPTQFDPRRFLPGAKPPARFTYLPFGAGPRVCIGAQFALTEATLVLARTCRAVRLRLVDDVKVEPVAVVTTYPDPLPTFHVNPR
ncbi:MAG: cytochrome P450 [Geminicoccaceae bacterium]|nr:MAG: cytochrome P450 [Geminicoccaceae bacterium]